ncbi:hypothetical protein C8P64_1690 [Christiangramia gaetbulicola]|uniref:DUF4397 domain-containing protein n=1 Tax=Christiangramia gaetbulicola TaxID=703340 RepID=A0A2T6AH69_9FLAO|nr:hypothetical protein [Christiangramia gaetbulicola]PTX43164.1 hypothetical protein C8P64_1690 [Christiangramia gaetbulicola]
MMTNRYAIPLLILILIASLSCNRKTDKHDPEFRVYNSTNSALTIQMNKQESSTGIEIAEKQTSEYQLLDPGIHNMEVKSSKSLLEHKIGIAAGEKYTCIIYGDPAQSSKINDATFSYKLHNIFEGSENFTKNGFLPSYMVFRDKIKLKKGLSALRAFHAATGMSPVTIKVKDGKSSKSLAKGLAYAKPVLSKHIKSGVKTLEVYWKGAPQPVISREYDFKSEKSYIIIFYNKENKPGIEILEN